MIWYGKQLKFDGNHYIIHKCQSLDSLYHTEKMYLFLIFIWIPIYLLKYLCIL